MASDLPRDFSSTVALSPARFEAHPDEINWGHVGTLNHSRARPRGFSNMAFGEALGGRMALMHDPAFEALQAANDNAPPTQDGPDGKGT